MTTSRTFLVIAAVATLAGFACQQADATPIFGLLNISGSGPSPDGSSVSIALFDVAVGGGTNTGAFTSIQNGTTVVTTSPFLFPGSIVLWSVDGFTMELGPIGEPIFQPHQITVMGMATLLGPGFNPTFGAQWTLISGTSGEFNFTLTSKTVVTPDSGMTIALFGVGLVAIAACRAKFATS